MIHRYSVTVSYSGKRHHSVKDGHNVAQTLKAFEEDWVQSLTIRYQNLDKKCTLPHIQVLVSNNLSNEKYSTVLTSLIKLSTSKFEVQKVENNVNLKIYTFLTRNIPTIRNSQQVLIS